MIFFVILLLFCYFFVAQFCRFFASWDQLFTHLKILLKKKAFKRRDHNKSGKNQKCMCVCVCVGGLKRLNRQYCTLFFTQAHLILQILVGCRCQQSLEKQTATIVSHHVLLKRDQWTWNSNVINTDVRYSQGATCLIQDGFEGKETVKDKILYFFFILYQFIPDLGQKFKNIGNGWMLLFCYAWFCI